VDRYGTFYGGFNAGSGYSKGMAGGNVSLNWLDGGARPSANQLNSFIGGYGGGISASYGPVIGPAVFRNWSSDGSGSSGIGLGTNDLSISGGKSWPLTAK
jgi:hypothetical protein